MLCTLNLNIFNCKIIIEDSHNKSHNHWQKDLFFSSTRTDPFVLYFLDFDKNLSTLYILLDDILVMKYVLLISYKPFLEFRNHSLPHFLEWFLFILSIS